MNDKAILEFFKEHGSKDGGNLIYFSCRYDGINLNSALKDLLDHFAIVYFDLEKHEIYHSVLGDSFNFESDYHPAVCLGVLLENLAEWKFMANMLVDFDFEILAYGIEEEQ